MLKKALGLGVISCLTGALVALGPSAHAEPETFSGQDPAAAAAASMALVEKIPLAEARRRVDSDERKQDAARSVLAKLGTSGAGAWIDRRTGDLFVNVVSSPAAEGVKAAGLQVNLVHFTGAALDAVMRSLDDEARVHGTGFVDRWYIDVPANRVVVVVPNMTRDNATARFLEFARSQGEKIRIEQGGEPIRDASDNLYGGQEVYSGGANCSTGFNVQGPLNVFGVRPQYVLTAGHCALHTSSANWYRNGYYLGHMSVYTTYNEDHAIISNPAPAFWVPQPSVWRYDGMVSRVIGWSNTIVGSYVCKSGRTTGWTCGYVTGVNVSAITSSGPKYGMVQTDMCVEPGDSGGGVLVGNRAAGLTSSSVTWGTSAVCGQKVGRPNVALFQPIGVVLARYGVTLRT